MIRVSNLSDGTEMWFHMDPVEAVKAAWATHAQPGEPMPEITYGRVTIGCGDWVTFIEPEEKE